MEDTIYLKFDTDYIGKIWWSDNPPADPKTAEGVIFAILYKLPTSNDEVSGNDFDGYELCGSELDCKEPDALLTDHIEEALEFIGFHVDMDYSYYDIISEDEANQILQDAIDECE